MVDRLTFARLHASSRVGQLRIAEITRFWRRVTSGTAFPGEFCGVWVTGSPPFDSTGAPPGSAAARRCASWRDLASPGGTGCAWSRRHLHQRHRVQEPADDGFPQHVAEFGGGPVRGHDHGPAPAIPGVHEPMDQRAEVVARLDLLRVI